MWRYGMGKNSICNSNSIFPTLLSRDGYEFDYTITHSDIIIQVTLDSSCICLVLFLATTFELSWHYMHHVRNEQEKWGIKL